ncbi:reverse transcriptase domain-containing protein [Tanacetum coccineum]|uniref:Reverse transcriptase domain-containing protein n=1 Tax=Tanacetum coccineum TaxID=301880 RepID=A0ABQ5GYF7_9ASTR
MEELLQAPTDCVGDAVVVPPILANQFELKISLLNLVTAIAFHGFENDDPHSHIQRFTKITQTVKLNNVPSDVVKLLLFPFSLEGAARTWLEKEPPNSITTWNDLVSKFVNRFFPPSKTTNLRNEITTFQQRFGETFSKVWDRFKALLNKCPHHGFSPLHQIDTFYNSLNQSDHDSINSAASVSSASGSSTQDATITALTKQVEALVSSMNRLINSIQNGCETCGGPHAYYECQATGGYTQEDIYATTGTYNAGANSYQPQGTRIRTKIDIIKERPQGVLPSNTVPNPREDLKVITTRSGVTLAGPSVPPPPLSSSKEVEQDPESTTDQVLTESTIRVPSPVVQPSPTSELPPAPSSVIPKWNPHQPPIPYPSRLNKEKLQDKSDIQKLPEKLGDFRKFPIPCDFPELEKCMALADLGASINLRPLYVWKKLMLPKLVPTRKFTFPADFVVIDYDVDPRVPLILGRPLLRTARALVDVYEEELILRDGDGKLIFHAESTARHPHKHGNDPTPSDLVVDSLKSSGSTTSHSLPEYESFCFDVDHIEEKSSGSNASHSDLSLPEYESFHFDLSIDPLPPSDMSDSYHEEFADELAHIVSSSEYDCFYFDIEPDPGELTILFEENISEDSTKELTSPELNDFPLFLSDCDSIFSEKFSEIDILVLFPSGNKYKVFDPRIFTINGVHSKRFSILLLDDFSSILLVIYFLFLTDPSKIETFLSSPSENEDKVFDPGILLNNGIFSFMRKSPHLLIDNFKIDKRHILSKISLMTESSVSFLLKDKEIRGESS